MTINPDFIALVRDRISESVSDLGHDTTFLEAVLDWAGEDGLTGTKEDIIRILNDVAEEILQ